MTRCIVCGHKHFYPVFNPGPQPLAALNLPNTQEEAKDALRFPMKFVACAFCGHVFNTDFDYTIVPYGKDSNRMYNSGCVWCNHLQYVIDKLLKYRSRWESGIAIDIGCGDGQFFSRLKSQMPQATYIGYEPGVEAERIRDFTVIRDYFIPERDLKRFRPSLLVCRHVLEHLEQPRDFVAEIAYWSSMYDLKPLVLFEVPCIDKAMRLGRMSDFLYEHVSNFTARSFGYLFETAGFTSLDTEVCYDDEVLVGLFECNTVQLNVIRDIAKLFRQQAKNSLKMVSQQLACMPAPIYFWGGTGKSAAFLNTFGVDSDRFPYVVDSDPSKVGRFVPGTSQKIRSVDWLLEHEPGIIVITTPWRARDIFKEIQQRGVRYKQVVVLWKGMLQQYDNV